MGGPHTAVALHIGTRFLGSDWVYISRTRKMFTTFNLKCPLLGIFPKENLHA